MMEKINKLQKFTIIRLSALGDIVLTTGVMKYFYEKHGYTFNVITKSKFSDLFVKHPAVKEVIALEDEQIEGLNLIKTWQDLAKKYKDSVLVDLHDNLRTNILGYLWKARVLRYNKFDIQRRLFLFSKLKFFADNLNEFNVTQRYARAINNDFASRKALMPKLYLTDDEFITAADNLRNFSEKPIALHPYATYKSKSWAVENWQNLIEKLDKNSKPYIVIGHGDGFKIKPENDFRNKYSLRESAALLANSSVLITNDSGPMHLASSVGVPVVALFGPTVAEWGFYPSGKEDIVFEHKLKCRPCSLHGKIDCKNSFECLTKTNVETVYNALTKFM